MIERPCVMRLAVPVPIPGRVMIRSVTGFEQLYPTPAYTLGGESRNRDIYIVRDENRIHYERHSYRAQKCLEPSPGVGISAIISLALDTD
jgi:hypothetical protein